MGQATKCFCKHLAFVHTWQLGEGGIWRSSLEAAHPIASLELLTCTVWSRLAVLHVLKPNSCFSSVGGGQERRKMKRIERRPHPMTPPFP